MCDRRKGTGERGQGGLERGPIMRGGSPILVGEAELCVCWYPLPFLGGPSGLDGTNRIVEMGSEYPVTPLTHFPEFAHSRARFGQVPTAFFFFVYIVPFQSSTEMLCVISTQEAIVRFCIHGYMLDSFRYF